MSKYLQRKTITDLVEKTIRTGEDLKTLKRLSKQLKPEDNPRSHKNYTQSKIDMYLDTYNTLTKNNDAELSYEGEGEFAMKKKEPLYMRKLALYQTYLSIVEDNGVDTAGWFFDPGQRSM